MRVPLLDLNIIHEPIHAQVMGAIEKVVKSQHFILGEEVEKLETRLAEYCGTRYAIGVSSGTDALLVALMALDLQPGDEVITSSYSFFATAGAIVRLGGRPVFVDIDPLSYNLDTTQLSSVRTVKTRGIIPVHLFGQCAEMGPLLKWAEHYRIPVIEDAAQAIGSACWDGRRAGSLGRLGCFSFFPSKNLGAFGDGGFVTTNDESLYKKIVRLRSHGAEPKYYHPVVGGNFRLDALQAAVLNIKLNHLDAWTEQRRHNARQYDRLFQDSGLLQMSSIRLPASRYDQSLHYPHIFNQFVIRAEHRDRLLSYLKEKGIGSEIYYPIPLHQQECFRSLGYVSGNFPHAEQASRESLALPIFPGLTLPQQEYVVEMIRAFYQL